MDICICITDLLCCIPELTHCELLYSNKTFFNKIKLDYKNKQNSILGGYRFFANKDINGLTNAFSRISSRSGSITQQAIQVCIFFKLFAFSHL